MTWRVNFPNNTFLKGKCWIYPNVCQVNNQFSKKKRLVLEVWLWSLSKTMLCMKKHVKERTKTSSLFGQPVQNVGNTPTNDMFPSHRTQFNFTKSLSDRFFINLFETPTPSTEKWCLMMLVTTDPSIKSELLLMSVVYWITIDYNCKGTRSDCIAICQIFSAEDHKSEKDTLEFLVPNVPASWVFRFGLAAIKAGTWWHFWANRDHLPLLWRKLWVHNLFHILAPRYCKVLERISPNVAKNPFGFFSMKMLSISSLDWRENLLSRFLLLFGRARRLYHLVRLQQRLPNMWKAHPIPLLFRRVPSFR